MRNVCPGALTFPIVRARCSGIALVSEDEIREAMRLLQRHCGVKIEPTAAVAPAAILFRKVSLEGRTGVAVVSGGNITDDDWQTLVNA
jgi:threonine dehydratase